ncbi:MAG: preprotein translocase subunit SecE [Candidatus Omnitrophota bacterium]
MLKKLKKIPQFFIEVREEVKKISWTTRHELMGTVVVVIVITSILTGYITLVDLGLAQLVKRFFGA